jgi:hypothetical protein
MTDLIDPIESNKAENILLVNFNDSKEDGLTDLNESKAEDDLIDFKERDTSFLDLKDLILDINNIKI